MRKCDEVLLDNLIYNNPIIADKYRNAWKRIKTEVKSRPVVPAWKYTKTEVKLQSTVQQRKDKICAVTK
jgi:hypothetical protein